MQRKKLGPQSGKALAYMRRMISSGSWKPNEKIPAIGTIAETLSISTPTVRKALRVLEQEKTIQDYDTLGFFVLSDALVQRNRRSRTSYLIHMASVNLDAARMAHDRRKIIGQYGIIYHPDTHTVLAHNILTHKDASASVYELDEIIEGPVTVKQLLESQGHELAALKKKYMRQQKLLRLARVVHLNKRELGITNG